jgi:hypothetical protein
LSIELRRTSRSRPAAAAPSPVFGLEQATRDEAIEVERRQLAADADPRRRIVPADRLATGGHELEQPAAGWLVKQGDRSDRVRDGVVVHAGILPESRTSTRP